MNSMKSSAAGAGSRRLVQEHVEDMRMKSVLGSIARAMGSTPTEQVRSVALDPFQYQPGLVVPDGYSKERILDALCTVSIDGSATGELRGYATADCERFLRTLELVPHGSGELLEIGGNPYFTTLLLRKFRPDYKLTLSNYFGGNPGIGNQEVRFSGFDGAEQSCTFSYHSLNIESWTFPFADEQMDMVVFGEVLEHMTNDPIHAIREISRVLKTSGKLVLTTPNAARLENVIALLEGRNMYDPYSAYGPYGRHNREYTRDELHRLMTFCGFEPEISYTANVHPDIPAGAADKASIAKALGSTKSREFDLGQYLFTRWRKTGKGESKRPSWLYRSYPAAELV